MIQYHSNGIKKGHQITKNAVEYIYAVMLLHSTGRKITEETVANVISSASLNPDHGRNSSLVSSLAEVDIEEPLQTPVPFHTTATATPAPPPEETAEKRVKEEKKEEEEEDIQGLGALFTEPPGHI